MTLQAGFGPVERGRRAQLRGQPLVRTVGPALRRDVIAGEGGAVKRSPYECVIDARRFCEDALALHGIATVSAGSPERVDPLAPARSLLIMKSSLRMPAIFAVTS
ncbi:hypothetical protein [Micromonospora sp. NPDC049679]|uniref:hypothetical protein n=1 Tax=Micromonospora sp. NPDC049679 TaxID=3155920 RepID=UPI0033D6E24A